MVGEGVLLTCLAHPDVERVLVVARKSARHHHDKLTELILPDFKKPQSHESESRGDTKRSAAHDALEPFRTSSDGRERALDLANPKRRGAPLCS